MRGEDQRLWACLLELGLPLADPPERRHRERNLSRSRLRLRRAERAVIEASRTVSTRACSSMSFQRSANSSPRRRPERMRDHGSREQRQGRQAHGNSQMMPKHELSPTAVREHGFTVKRGDHYYDQRRSPHGDGLLKRQLSRAETATLARFVCKKLKLAWSGCPHLPSIIAPRRTVWRSEVRRVSPGAHRGWLAPPGAA